MRDPRKINDSLKTHQGFTGQRYNLTTLQQKITEKFSVILFNIVSL